MNLAQICSSLIFITTIAALTSEEYFQLNDSSIPNHNRLSLNVHPVGYDIKLYLMYEENAFNFPQPSIIKQQDGDFHFYGESNITIQIHNLTQNIKLHASNLAINPADIILTDLIRARLFTIEKFTHNLETDFLDLCFSDILYSGSYNLNIKFHGRITNNNAKSFVSSSYINREENLILLITPHIGARQLFPCWDEPYLKTTFNISIKHQFEFMALSNMPIRGYHRDGDGLMWTYFHTTPPMSTYQVSIILTNFRRTRIRKHNINYSLWYAKRSRLQSLKYAMQVIENITFILASEFNDTKIPEIDHIVIPNYPHNADISKLGLVFHREADLICDDKSDPILRKIEIARSVASKIAYQWLGNVITPSWWSHFWLHEGLSILFGEEAVVKALNNSQIMDLFIVQNQYDSLRLGSHFAMNPPLINSSSQIDLIFNFPRYVKGIVVLRMLQNTVTDKVFRNCIRICLKTYKYRSLTLEKFLSIQEKIASHSYEHYISRDFFYWIVYEHYPVISLTQEKPGADYVQLSQYFNTSQNSYGQWWIPISLITKISLKKPVNVLLAVATPSISVTRTAEDDWIMVDVQQAGYYRVKYDVENLRKIALYLNSEEYKGISVINRAKIIDDAFHFLLTREINATVFWKLAKYLTQETDYAAWYPMLKVFEYISSVFPLMNGEIDFMHVKKTMREILTKPLKVLGFEEHPLEEHLIKCLRQEIVKWACTVELSECQMNKSEQIVKNPALLKTLPEWQQFVYCESFKLIPQSDMSNDEYEVYNSICLKDDNATHQEFENFWPKSSKLGRQYGVQEGDIRMHISIFHLLIATHAKNDIIILLLSFFHHLKPREMNTTAALINIINHIYSIRILNKLTYFLKKEKLIYLGQIAPKVHSKIETRISEINRHIEHLDVLLNYTFELKEMSDVKTSNVKTSDVRRKDQKIPRSKYRFIPPFVYG